jgi:trk system potassium uptake protein TrkA
MRVVIVGAGEVGYHVAERLAREQHDVTVVDVDADRLDYVQSHLDVAVTTGSGASPAVLERAGVREADLFLAVTSIDEVNLVACAAADGKGELVKVARVSNPDFFAEGNRLEPARFRVHLMINPERELALETFRLLQSTAAIDLAEFAGGAVQLIGLKVLPDAAVTDRTLAAMGEDLGPIPMLTVAIERDGTTTVPTGASVVEAGDHVYVVAATDAIPRVLELCGHEPSDLKRVMIAGASYEAFYLAQLLTRHRIQTTLVVKERERAQQFAEKLDRALVLNADATDVELLELEGVGGVDAFVAFTDDDESNILSSIAAKHAGAKQVVTLINRTSYVALVRRIGLDAAVSPRISAANAILQYVRRGSVVRVATLRDSDAEAISFQVPAGSPVIGIPLAEFDFPEGAIVATIVRGRRVIVPRGRDAVQVGDSVIVFALPEAIERAVAIFSE